MSFARIMVFQCRTNSISFPTSFVQLSLHRKRSGRATRTMFMKSKSRHLEMYNIFQRHSLLDNSYCCPGAGFWPRALLIARTSKVEIRVDNRGCGDWKDLIPPIILTSLYNIGQLLNANIVFDKYETSGTRGSYVGVSTWWFGFKSLVKVS